MFTVKIVTTPAHEVIVQSSEVRRANGTLFLKNENGVEVGLNPEAALVFVMNDNGATVAKYHFDHVPPSSPPVDQ